MALWVGGWLGGVPLCALFWEGGWVGGVWWGVGRGLGWLGTVVTTATSITTRYQHYHVAKPRAATGLNRVCVCCAMLWCA